MASSVNSVPQGFHTVTPHLVVQDIEAAIEFYKNALGAQEQYRMLTPDGQSTTHAELKLGDSFIFLGGECPNMEIQSPVALNGSPVTLHLYVDDVDAWFNRAVSAGAKVTMPVQDMFWGDRYGKIVDPFGHHWSIATQIEKLSPEEINQRAAAAFAA